jgi:hypothetical protein
VPQHVVMFSGALLILIGIVATLAQLSGELGLFGLNPPTIVEPARGRSAATSQFKVSTHYVGVELVVIGAALELGSLLGIAFSRRRTKEEDNQENSAP